MVATKRLLDEEPSTQDLLGWIMLVEAHFPVEVQPKLVSRACSPCARNGKTAPYFSEDGMNPVPTLLFKQILLLHQHHERAQLLRTRLGQQLSSSLTNFNHAPPDSSHLCDCTFISTIWKLWEQSRDFNSVSQLEGFVKSARAGLSSLEGVADERQKESLEEAVKAFKELLKGVKGISGALVGA